MVTEVEKKLLNREKIANILLSVFGVTSHKELYMNKEIDRSIIQVLRVNIMNLFINTDKQKVRKELQKYWLLFLFLKSTVNTYSAFSICDSCDTCSFLDKDCFFLTSYFFRDFF
jgi:hypothetical protein